MLSRAAVGAREEREWRTRKARIDPRLAALGWQLARFGAAPPGAGEPRAIEEYETASGPADYALAADGRVLGIVEAKKLSLGPQNVLTQAERYSRGAQGNPFDFDGFHVPFLYSTNGEVIWFDDVRHPLHRSRRVTDFHTPDALREMLARDFEGACQRLAALPNAHAKLRPYQAEANAAIERAIVERKRAMLVAMATGTGKTFTMVNQVYRLMKAGVARRVLFLVDRRVLARQAAQAFAAFEAEPGMKFTNIYQVYSQGIQHGDDEDDRLDFEKLPNAYLEQPQPSHTYVYVCTIQRMAINLFGRGAVFEGDDETIDDDAERLNIPIHAFDVVIADECHRGYTSAVDSPWRRTLDHFDAIKIGLTATPAAHTTTYFKDVVYRYEYERAVAEGWLVDYNAVALKSGVRMNGVFLQEGEQVGTIDAASGAEQLDTLEAERAFDATEIERQVTVPDSNRKLLEEIKRHALAHEQEYGRFPKTLIFAVNDIPHVSHADMLVDMARDVFGRGNAFVEKITGKVDRPLQKIKEFRNRERIGIVVTVDLLSTGVDIPDLEYIVFLRPVKSRILFEQIMGRGTRKGWLYPTKSHFTVFDCFDGTLLEYFRQATAITVEPPVRETKTIAQIVEDIWQNRDRDYNVRCLVKRLQRVDKEMSGEARELFAAYEIVDGDLAGFAARLPGLLRQDFTGTMRLLRDPGFQDLLVHYPRPPKGLLVAYDTVDEVTSRRLIRDGAGHEYRPEDYLTAFWRFVREKATEIEAIGILLERPRDWSTDALGELRRKLAAAPERFTVERLQQAHEAQYRKALVDVISMVKHAADAEQPLLTAAERVDRAIARITAGRALSDEQAQWLERIRQHLVANLSIDRDDFEEMPVLANAGGWGRANRAFDGRLTDLVRNLNEAVAA